MTSMWLGGMAVVLLGVFAFAGPFLARKGDRAELLRLSSELARAAALAEGVPALQGEIARLRGHADALQGENTALVEERARLASELEAERRAAAERAAEADRARGQVRSEIELLATRLLEEKGSAMLNASREGLAALLQPVAARLREFEAKVDKTYDQENRDRASLLTSLAGLQEAQARLHQDAESLSRALTGDSKAQGDWGELVLERVLETAGLTQGREYDLQVTCPDGEGGRKRPDALVYLPGDRVIVVDAKCSLTAFVAATRAGCEAAREAALDAHLQSLRSHVRELAGKCYPDVVQRRTVDVVFMFVPSEAAFQAALSREPALHGEAFRQRVVICSPTTLLAALQIVNHLWRAESQNANAEKIACEAGKLVEKLAAFLVDLDAVGARLEQAQTSFGQARSKLASGRGNALKTAAAVAQLGARTRPDKIAPLLREAAGEEEGDDALEVLALTPSAAQRPSKSPAA